MRYRNLNRVFNEQVKGLNIMTPNIIEYGQTGDYIWELSSGEGFDHEPIFGVTFLDPDEAQINTEISKLFHDEAKARRYAETIKEDDE